VPPGGSLPRRKAVHAPSARGRGAARTFPQDGQAVDAAGVRLPLRRVARGLAGAEPQLGRQAPVKDPAVHRNAAQRARAGRVFDGAARRPSRRPRLLAFRVDAPGRLPRSSYPFGSPPVPMRPSLQLGSHLITPLLYPAASSRPALAPPPSGRKAVAYTTAWRSDASLTACRRTAAVSQFLWGGGGRGGAAMGCSARRLPCAGGVGAAAHGSGARCCIPRSLARPRRHP
jgi:hypothetical protein